MKKINLPFFAVGIISLFLLFISSVSFAQWSYVGGVTGAGSFPNVSILDANTVFVAGGPSYTPAIFKSTNGGVNFTNVGASGISFSLSCFWAQTDHIYYGGTSDGLGDAYVYKTTNGGTNWTFIFSAGGYQGFINGVIFSRTLPQFGFIESDPNSGPGGPYWVQKTNNGGNNWISQSPPGLAYMNSGDNSLFIIDSSFYGFGSSSTDTAVLPKSIITSNNGANWYNAVMNGAPKYPNNFTGGHYITTLAFNTNKLNGIGGSSYTSNTVARTMDGGVTWFSQSIPSTVGGGSSYARYVPNSNIVYLISSYTSTQSFKSTNNGANWTSLTWPSGKNLVNSLDLIYSGGNAILYAVCEDGSVCKLVDPVAVPWYEGTALPVATCNGGGASYTRNDTGWVYTIGGGISSGLTANVRRYNVNTNIWSDMAPLPTPLEYFAAATLKNNIYVIGGYNGTNCLNSFYKYDINLNSWATMGINFPLAAADCKAVGYQDSLIYVAGGYTTTAISNVYLYNKNSNTFRAATSLPAARQDGAFSRSGDTLVYVGGLTTGSVVTATTYKGLISQTNRSTITWTTGADHPGGPREGWDAANWGSYGVIAVGGYNGTSFTNSCYRYSPGANTWTILTDKPTTEYTSFVGSVYVGNNIWKLIAAGGWTGFNLSTNEIYTETIPTVPIPSLISPVNGSIGVSLIPLLDWNDASGAISYRIQISSDSTFATIQWDTSGITVSQAQVPAEKLTLSTKYYWRVNATNSVGSGPWSTIWNFTTVTTGIHKISSEVPNSFRVYQNYPNPFNPSTKIRYDLPKNSFVKLVVFDMLGREIETLVNENQTTGVYEATFDASQYPSGLYFYRLTTENYSETKKMILMK